MSPSQPFIHPTEFVKGRIEQYGVDSPQALSWGDSYRIPQLLFGEMIRDIELFDGMTVLDCGCGKFDLYGYLQERVRVGQYVGIDFCKELVDCGLKKFPGTTGMVGDFADYGFDPQFDFVFCSGVFPYAVLELDPFAYVRRAILRMWSSCTKAVVFNSFSNRFRINANENGWVSNPVDLIRFSMEWTPNIVVRHVDNGTKYFTITMVKK